MLSLEYIPASEYHHEGFGIYFDSGKSHYETIESIQQKINNLKKNWNYNVKVCGYILAHTSKGEA